MAQIKTSIIITHSLKKRPIQDNTNKKSEIDKYVVITFFRLENFSIASCPSFQHSYYSDLF